MESGSVAAAPAQVRGIDERGARGIHFGHERIERPGQSRLEWIHGWEVARTRGPSDIGVPARVESNAAAEVVAASAEVCRVDQRGACTVDLGHEGVCRAIQRSLYGVLRREVA